MTGTRSKAEGARRTEYSPELGTDDQSAALAAMLVAHCRRDLERALRATLDELRDDLHKAPSEDPRR